MVKGIDDAEGNLRNMIRSEDLNERRHHNE